MLGTKEEIVAEAKFLLRRARHQCDPEGKGSMDDGRRIGALTKAMVVNSGASWKIAPEVSNAARDHCVRELSLGNERGRKVSRELLEGFEQGFGALPESAFLPPVEIAPWFQKAREMAMTQVSRAIEDARNGMFAGTPAAACMGIGACCRDILFSLAGYRNTEDTMTAIDNCIAAVNAVAIESRRDAPLLVDGEEEISRDAIQGFKRGIRGQMGLPC